MRRILVYLFLALSGLVTLAQPAGAANAPTRDAAGFLPVTTAPAEPSPAKPNPDTVASTTTTAAGDETVTSGYILDDKHRLKPGDIVSFEIKQDNTNRLQLTVTESSELDIPYIGRISVTNVTCKQLANEIKVALERDFYNHATVIIGLDALGKVVGKVMVVGQVKNPSTVDIPANENFTASKAILKAGGFSDFADKKRVVIFRKIPGGGTKTIKVNLKNVFEDGRIDEDIPLEPDDQIFVPKRLIGI